jgi:hypothetical protein
MEETTVRLSLWLSEAVDQYANDNGLTRDEAATELVSARLRGLKERSPKGSGEESFKSLKSD